MIRAAIYGFGNIGHFALEAIQESPDFQLAGVISSSLAEDALGTVPVVRDIFALLPLDVVLLCTPSRSVPALAEKLLSQGISTVDSFDIHTEITALRSNLDKAAKAGGAAAIISAGWDPGTDSMIRAILEAMAPKGLTYTNFGPGMSMGHSVAAKGIEGVYDALSMTIPTGTGVHRRMVYVQLKPDADSHAVSAAIAADPYFSHDDTHVIFVENVDELKDMGHGVDLVRKGVSGKTQNQRFSFEMSINNPALTSQIMVAAARAVQKQQPGCYTMIEIPPIHLLPGNPEDIIQKLV